MRQENSHIWDKHEDEYYPEPKWVGRRLFEEEPFQGSVCDPCCGRGNMLEGAAAAGLSVAGFDLVDRGCRYLEGIGSFLDSTGRHQNIATNPPFELAEAMALHALPLVSGKIAMVYPTRRLNAAGKWLRHTPLYRVWYLTPRPSMPPGPVYEELQRDGKEGSGGKQDFAILVWLTGFRGAWSGGWLHRDKDQQA